MEQPTAFYHDARPKIAGVSGDKVIPDETTIEEVEKYHRDTLIAVIEKTNQEYAEYQSQLEREVEIKQLRGNEHKESINDVLKRIKFE